MHTPGPWRAFKTVFDQHAVEAFNSDEKETECLCRVDGWGSEIDIANARLIAAAPELLEALKAVVAISDRKHDAWDAAEAAIAKAKGN